MPHVPAVLRALGAGPAMRRALLAYLLFAMAEMVTWFSVILFAFAEGGPKLAGLVAVVQVLPAAVAAPILAGMLERLPRDTALVVGYLVAGCAAAVGTVALALNAPLPVILIFAALTTISLAVVRPIHFAALPQLSSSPGDLVSANAISSIADGLALFLGPIIAGLLTQSVGTWLAYATSTVVLLVASGLCLGLGLTTGTAEEIEEEQATSEWRAALDGLLALWRDWAALALLLVMATRFVVAGASDVLGVTFSEEVLHLGESGAGVLLAGLGIGALIGGAISTSFAMRPKLSPVVGGSGTLLGLAVGAVAIMTILSPAMAMLAVAGLAGSILMMAGRTLLQRTTDERVLARVFAVQEGISLLGIAVGAALAPLLVEALHPAGAFAFFGIALTLFVIAAFLLIRKLDARAVYLPVETELLRGVPFLSVLPAYDLERLARSAEWRDVAAGTAVIVQGDAGTHYFVIDSGTFRVTVDDVERAEALGPGDGFGEIALLYAIPRTATVRAETDGRLLAISSEEFLGAVTGSQDGRAIAQEVTDAYLARDAARR